MQIYSNGIVSPLTTTKLNQDAQLPTQPIQGFFLFSLTSPTHNPTFYSLNIKFGGGSILSNALSGKGMIHQSSEPLLPPEPKPEPKKTLWEILMGTPKK
jgi:hypothetical protein